MANFSTPFGNNSGRRLPTADEKVNGFPCGAADQTLFNGLFHRIESEIGSVISHAGITPSDDRFTQLREAIEALISAATGGGETSQFLLISQASARLPIFPEILSTDGRMNISTPSTGTVRMPGNVEWLHRGIVPMTTVETDFNTVASRTYHLRWSLANGYELKDLSDNTYNPSTADESSTAFDSTYDDMLICRVVTNSSNIATMTSLANKNDLAHQSFVSGTDLLLSGLNGANWLVQESLNWSRSPQNFSLDIAQSHASGAQDDRDVNFVNTSQNRNTNLVSVTTEIPIDRYQLNTVYIRDGAQTILKMNFNARG